LSCTSKKTFPERKLNLNNFTFRGCCCPFEYEFSQQEKGRKQKRFNFPAQESKLTREEKTKQNISPVSGESAREY
jgi:hypothetical protein